MNKKISGLSLPLFFVNPFIGFVLSLLNIKSKVSAFIYISFAVIFGYSISFTNDSADSFRYAVAFTYFDNTLNYETIIKLYSDGELRDAYRLLIFYFTSIFTNNPKVMFAVAGLIYGYVSYLIMRLFITERGNQSNFYLFIITIIFMSYNTLANINGFRFWTGALVFFYSTYHYIIKKEIKWGLLILLTPLIHFGFTLLVPVIISYRFLNRFFYNQHKVHNVLIYLFVFSFFLSWFLGTNFIKLNFIVDSGILSDGAVGKRIDYLNSEETANLVEQRRESSLFLSVQKFFEFAIRIYVFIIVLNLRKILTQLPNKNIEINRFFSFVVFYYSFSFIAISFPSGTRFMNIAHLFLFLFLAKVYLIINSKKVNNLILLAAPVFAFQIAFINFVLPTMILTPTFWYGNLFWLIIDGIDYIPGV